MKPCCLTSPTSCRLWPVTLAAGHSSRQTTPRISAKALNHDMKVNRLIRTKQINLLLFITLCFVAACTHATKITPTNTSDCDFDPNHTYMIFTTGGDEYYADNIQVTDSVLIINNLETDLLNVKTPIAIQMSEIQSIEIHELNEGITVLAVLGTGLVLTAIIFMVTWEWSTDNR